MSEIPFVNRLGDALENATRRDLAAESRSPRMWLPRRPFPRLAWAVLPVLLLFAVGAGAYAASPTGRHLLHQSWWPGLQETGGVQEHGLSRTVEGITFTLERAYADRNLVVLEISASGLPDPRMWSGRVSGVLGSLRTADGTELQAVTGSRDSAVSVVGFDASRVTDGVEELDLVLTMNLPRPQGQEGMIGPFIFEFTVPVTPTAAVTSGRLELDQTVEADSFTITLEEVSIAPGAVRATIRVPEELFGWGDELEEEGSWIIRLRLPDGRVPSYSHGRYIEHVGDEVRWVETFFTGVNPPQGEWMLVFALLRDGSDVSLPEWPAEYHVAGPWEFRFEVQ